MLHQVIAHPAYCIAINFLASIEVLAETVSEDLTPFTVNSHLYLPIRFSFRLAVAGHLYYTINTTNDGAF